MINHDVLFPLAVRHDSIDIMNHLMSRARKSCNYVMSELAASSGSVRAIKILYDNGFYFSIDAINKAIKNNHTNIVRWFIDNNVNKINYISSIGKAIKHNRLEILKLLLSNDKDIVFHKQTIIELATKHNRLEILQWLLEN